MLSYHGQSAVKEKYQARFAEHRRLDQVVQGTDFESGRGCFVGCTLDAYQHSRFPTELGWPEWLAHLADKIFEGIPKSEAAQFGTDLLAAVPVGVNLEPVRWQLAILRHKKDLASLGTRTEDYIPAIRVAIQGVIELCEKELASAARSAAESAAESAARSAAESAARSAAESAAFQWERDTLLALVKACVVAE